MTSLIKIVFTFIGDITRDSRALRFIQTLEQFFPVGVISLASSQLDFRIGNTRIVQFGYRDRASLRSSLRHFWKHGTDADVWRSASLAVGCDLYSLPLATRIAAGTGGKVLYDSRELYSAIAALRHRRSAQLYWSFVERIHVRRCRAILTVNSSLAGELQHRFPRADVRILRNYPTRIPSGRTSLLRDSLGIPDGFKILLSQGGLQEGRGSMKCLEALKSINDCVLVFLGDGPLRNAILSRAEDFGVSDRVYMHDAVSSAELPDYTASADVGLCVIENYGKSYYLSLPNKLFEYIAAGVPVIGSRFPEIAGIVEKHGVGITVQPDDAGSIADAAVALTSSGEIYRRCSENCKRVRDAFLWKEEEQKLLSVVEDAIR